MIAIYRARGLSLCKIASKLGRNKSTISRELKRNSGEYLPSCAQAAYHKRRKKCRPPKLLEQPDLFALVKKFFLDLHCSPEQIANRLKLEKYPIPYQPWQRGTNENTNGLLREYFPKSYDFNALSDEDLQKVVEQLNRRPRKCLGYRTPQEVYFSSMLHSSSLFKLVKNFIRN